MAVDFSGAKRNPCVESAVTIVLSAVWSCIIIYYNKSLCRRHTLGFEPSLVHGIVEKSWSKRPPLGSAILNALGVAGVVLKTDFDVYVGKEVRGPG